MKSQRPRLFAIENEIHIVYPAPGKIDDYDEHCPMCDSDDTSHIADIIQYGMFADKCTSLFACASCQYKYFWTYECHADGGYTYLPLWTTSNGGNDD